MNRTEKAKFIRSLCNSVRNEIIKRIQYMPEGWDGIELREYIAREFNRQCYRGGLTHRRKLRDFKNTVATRMGL